MKEQSSYLIDFHCDKIEDAVALPNNENKHKNNLIIKQLVIIQLKYVKTRPNKLVN